MGDLDWSSGWLAGAPVRVLDTVVLDGAGAPRAWQDVLPRPDLAPLKRDRTL